MRAKDGERAIIQQTNPVRTSSRSQARATSWCAASSSPAARTASGSWTRDFVTIEDCEIHDTGDVAISRQLRRHVRRPADPAQSHPPHQRHRRGHVPRLQQQRLPGRQQPDRGQLHPPHQRRRPSSRATASSSRKAATATSIRDNVIHDTNYPGILTYSTVGNGAAERHRTQRDLERERQRDPVGGRRDHPQQHRARRDRSRCRAHQAGSPSQHAGRAQHDHHRRATASTCATSSARCSSRTTRSTRRAAARSG